jgi:hypothetical protein
VQLNGWKRRAINCPSGMHGVCLIAGKRSLHGYPADFASRLRFLYRAVHAGLCARAALDLILITGSRPCRERGLQHWQSRSIDPVWRRSATRRVVKTGRNLLVTPGCRICRSCSTRDQWRRCQRSDSTEKNPRPSRGRAGVKFWGKQIEMAVSPWSCGPKCGQRGVGPKSTAAQRARIEGTPMPALPRRVVPASDPAAISPPRESPTKLPPRLKTIGHAAVGTAKFRGLARVKRLILHERVGTMVPTLGSEHRPLEIPAL